MPGQPEVVQQIAGAQGRVPAPRRPLFLVALALAAVLVACKVLDLDPSHTRARTLLTDLAVAAHQDLAFVAASALVAFFLLLITRRSPRIERIVWAAWVAYACLCAFYGVLSYRIFGVIYLPLTYREIHHGGFAFGWSSLKGWVSIGFVIGLLAAPLSLAALARFASSPHRPRSIVVPALQALVFALGIQLYLQASHTYENAWRGRVDKAVADNPHLTLARSLWAEVARKGRSGDPNRPGSEVEVALDVHDLGAFPTAYLADFEPLPPREYAPFAPNPPRNVIVYVMESVGAEHLDPYGATFGVTPRLAEAASRAVVFDHVSAAVGASEASLIGITLSVYVPLSWRWFTEENPRLAGTTLAQVVRPRGYRTLFVSATDMRYARQDAFLEDRGFDEVLHAPKLGCDSVSPWGVADACAVDRLLRWIDADRGRPFFAAVWTNQTHEPYAVAPGPARRAPSEAAPVGFDDYLSALHETDRQIGRLLDALRERGLSDDTLVVITGDHGEAFARRHRSSLHGFDIYQENVHVPCILHNPRLFPATRRMKAVGGHIDINPTIAHVLGLPAPGDWQGRSLLAEGRPEHAYFFSAQSDLLVGVRDARHKYIVNLGNGRAELYDLEADPGEQRNLSAELPDRAAELRAHLAAWVRSERERYRQGDLTLVAPGYHPLWNGPK